MKVIIAAAGTGGHINPGIAIANKIKKENPDADITFVGTTRGLENELVPKAGYKLKAIEAYGISRKINIQNIKNIFKTLKGFRGAKKIVKEINPDIVIGTGGYICGPTALAAVKGKIPVVLHESNAFPGISVKLLSKKVDTILVGFQEAVERLPRARKVVVTGNPTNVGMHNMRSIQEVKQELDIKNNLPIVLAFGGSQGARSINEALMGIISEERLQSNSKLVTEGGCKKQGVIAKKLNEQYQLIWACGLKQYENIIKELSEKNIDVNNIKNTKIVPYIYNMEEVMNIADVVVSRSGAMTITEVAIVGKPAIFIPYPFATENHQEYNAKVLENVGAAKIILDKDLTSEILTKTLNRMLENKDMLRQMGQNAKRAAIYDVEDRIYDEIKIAMQTKLF